LEGEAEGSLTEEVVDGGGERTTPEVVAEAEEPRQTADRQDRIPTMPFHKTRSGRVSQPPERLSDFMAIPVESEIEKHGTKTTTELTNDIKGMLSKLQCMVLPREIQSSYSPSVVMESLPSLADLEQLLIDVGESTRVTIPDSVDTKESTVSRRELSDVSWPTLNDSHTGGKSSRVGRAAHGRIGYKEVHMER
jgi:hypothetical protein